MSIYLTAIIKSNPDSHQELKTMLLSMVVESRKETACLQYDLHESDDLTTFIFHEEWQSQQGLDEHNAKPYIVDFVSRSGTLAESVVLYKTEKLA